MAIEINRASLEETGDIDSGSTAEVYPYGDKYVVKLYKKNILLKQNSNELRSFIEDLIKVRNNADDSIRAFVDSNFTWPLDIALENGEFCGFIMNRIPEEYEGNLNYNGKTKRKQLVYDLWLSGKQILKKRGLPLPNRAGRIVISQMLLRGIKFLHDSNIIMGDISGKNMLIRFDTRNPQKNSLMFVDVDSYRGYGAEGLKNPIDTSDSPGWKSPDPDEKISPETDVYKMCLAIVRLYTLNKPCTMDPPNRKREYERFLKENYGEALACISEEVGPLFSSAVKRGLSYDSINRPSADELITVLHETIRDKNKGVVTAISAKNLVQEEKPNTATRYRISNERNRAETKRPQESKESITEREQQSGVMKAALSRGKPFKIDYAGLFIFIIALLILQLLCCYMRRFSEFDKLTSCFFYAFCILSFMNSELLTESKSYQDENKDKEFDDYASVFVFLMNVCMFVMGLLMIVGLIFDRFSFLTDRGAFFFAIAGVFIPVYILLAQIRKIPMIAVIALAVIITITLCMVDFSFKGDATNTYIYPYYQTYLDAKF